MERKTVTINGRLYDPISGLPVTEVPKVSAPAAEPVQTAAASKRSVHAGNVHAQIQRSHTLRRSALKRPAQQQSIEPVQKKPASPAIVHHKRPVTVPRVAAKSPVVSKFAAQPRPLAAPRVMDIGPMKHPHVVKAQAQIDAKRVPEAPKPARIIKEEAIRTAIQNTVRETKAPKRGFRHPGIASIITASFALLVLGGYLTYLNMPSLSVRVAAAAAGIDASYPTYHPDGYSLNGPVAYDKGQVSIKFGANAGPQHFTINQAKSSWDSAAVLDNYVVPKAGSDYATYSERGLTIYTFDEGVAWVNGGILYTIEGDARLSSEQIRHIATSFL